MLSHLPLLELDFRHTYIGAIPHKLIYSLSISFIIIVRHVSDLLGSKKFLWVLDLWILDLWVLELSDIKTERLHSGFSRRTLAFISLAFVKRGSDVNGVWSILAHNVSIARKSIDVLSIRFNAVAFVPVTLLGCKISVRSASWVGEVHHLEFVEK